MGGTRGQVNHLALGRTAHAQRVWSSKASEKNLSWGYGERRGSLTAAFTRLRHQTENEKRTNYWKGTFYPTWGRRRNECIGETEIRETNSSSTLVAGAVAVAKKSICRKKKTPVLAGYT